MTYSIVARDPASGRFGVAIQTAWPFVGSTCPWVESGVGAVTTQSFTEVAHGPNGLALLRTGRGATDALAALLETDPGREVRQWASSTPTAGPPRGPVDRASPRRAT
jgi:uncharacterized Ntn-hydrolase superfamily protein